MRHSAIATDPMQFRFAFRQEFGLPSRLGDEPVIVMASTLDGDGILDLLAISQDGHRPIVFMRLHIPCKLDEPSDIWMFLPVGTTSIVQTGYTLWAGKAGDAVRIVPSDGRADECFGIAAKGLVELPCVPLGIEASTQAGIERATERFSERFRGLASLRDMKPMAA